MDTAARIRVIAEARRRGVEEGRREGATGAGALAARVRLLEQRLATAEATISELIETLSADATRRLEALEEGRA